MKGASAEERAHIISQAGGITNVTNQKDIAEALKAIASGKTGVASSILSKVTGSAEYQDSQKEKQLHEAEAKDPLMTSLRDHSKRAADALEEISKGKPLNVVVTKDNSADPKNGENGAAAAPQPGK